VSTAGASSPSPSSSSSPSPGIEPERGGLPFGPDSVTWDVMRDPVVGLAAGTALLLQVPHPSVAAGVAEHSDYTTDPFARLWGTLHVMGKLSFGTPEESRAMAATLRRIHRPVRGVTAEGVPYRASDPDLLVWVWATLLVAALAAYERVHGRLSPVDRERLQREQLLVARACGVPEGRAPATTAEFDAYVADVLATTLRPTPVARQVIALSRRPPLPRPLGAVLGAVNDAAMAGFLPAPLRRDLGLELDATRRRRFRALLAVARAGRILPRPVRQLPMAYLVRRDEPLRWFRTTPPTPTGGGHGSW
jgi:uncharacterized protein (DUF2236 family)